MGWSLHEASDDAQRSSRSIEHTHQALAAILALENGLSQAESALRGYGISGNVSFLVDRDMSLASLGDSLTRLAAFAADSPEHKKRIAVLRDLIAKRVAIMNATVQQYDIGGTAAAASILLEAPRTSESIYGITGEMQQMEQKLLETRQGEEDFRYRRTTVLLIGAALLALLIVVPSYVAFTLQTRARERVEHKLYTMADSILGVVFQYRSSADGISRYDFLSTGLDRLFGIERKAALQDASLIRNAIVVEDKRALSVAIVEAAKTLSR